MTTQQLNLLPVISLAACWGAVVLAWLAGAIYYQSREPEERTRASYLSPILITTIIMVVVSAAVPRADWLPLEVHAPGIRLLGLAILLAATALTLWARLALDAIVAHLVTQSLVPPATCSGNPAVLASTIRPANCLADAP